jgi:hypothetical protein
LNVIASYASIPASNLQRSITRSIHLNLSIEIT